MIKKFLWIFVVVMAGIGCESQKKAEGNINSLQVCVSEAISYDSPLKPEQTISLEVKGNKFPGMIHCAQIVNDTLYILDTSKAQGLYVYDKNGRFLYAYDKVGQGVDEFVRLGGFQICGRYIYLFDSSRSQILVLNKSCEYVSTQRLGDIGYVLSLAREENGGLWINRGNNGRGDAAKLLYQKSDTAAMETVLSIPEELQGKTLSPLNTFVVYDSTLHYMPDLEPCIYECHEGTARLVYRLDFGGDWPNQNFFSRNADVHPFFLLRKLSEMSYVTELNFLEDDSFLSLYFRHEGMLYLFIYHKATKRQQLICDREECLYQPLCVANGRLYVARENEESFAIETYDLLKML